MTELERADGLAATPGYRYASHQQLPDKALGMAQACSWVSAVSMRAAQCCADGSR